MKSENQLAYDWFIFNFFNSFGLIDLVVVGCFLCVCFGHYFSRKKLVLINLMQFFSRKFTVTSVIKIYMKMLEFWVHLDFAYSMNFQIRQILSTNQHFSGNYNDFSTKHTLALVKISEKVTSIFLVGNLNLFCR